MPTSTVENYLKAIHELGSDGSEPVAIGRIAEELAVTAGTVTTMMKQLDGRGLVTYQPRQGVSLSDPGRRAALQVLRRHRLIELFLVEVLGLDWNEVHREAEVLEHAISDRLLERMDEMLGHPATDPHGAPIPDAAGHLPEQAATVLRECEPGSYELVRIEEDSNGEFLDWLAHHELRPGAGFELLAHDEPAGILRLKVSSRRGEVQLGTTAASRLLVRPRGGA